MKHSVIVFFVWHGLESCWRLAVVEPDESIVFYGLESCWCFGLFESDADETLSSHRSESTFLLVVICAFRTVFCLAEARLLLAFGCFGTEALFFMGSKGDVKHSVCVFFAWHGLESCWCFGLFESDADETLSSHRSESTACGCSGTEPDQGFVFYSFFIFLAGFSGL